MGKSNANFTTGILLWIFLEYLTYNVAKGQTEMITIQNRTFPVCKSHLCTSTSCDNPQGTILPCRCDYACSYFGDCCVNQESQCERVGDSEQRRDFLEVVEAVDISQLSCVDLSPLGEQYMMVTSCPGEWNDEEVRSRCEDYQPSSDIDINSVPVAQDGLTYRNLYCATCNRLTSTDLTPWTVDFLCPPLYSDFIQDGSKTLSDLLNDSKCKLAIKPPGNSSASTARQCLTSGIIGDCPSGTNQELRDMCVGSGYHGLTDDRGITYRNPYCKVCHDNSNISLRDSYGEVEEICQRLQPTTKRPPDRIRPTKRPPVGNDTDDRDVGSLQPISLIMDFSQDSTIKVVNSESVIKEVEISCEQGEVFDPFIQDCLTLSCAQGYELRDNACYRLVPPLNLSCGADDDELMIALSVTIQNQNPDSDCLSDSAVMNITQVIGTTLSLPTNVLQRAESDSENNNCTKFVNNVLNMKYEIDPLLLSYSELEDKVDRSLLHQDVIMSSEYILSELSILQHCVSISGVNGCSGELQLLPNAEVLTINDTMYVYDNDTGNLYHSYETFFEAQYRLQNEDPDSTYGKMFSIEICKQPKLLTCSLITQNASYFVPLNGSTGFLSNTMTGELLEPHEYVLTSSGQIQYCVPDTFGRNGTMHETTEVEIFTYDSVQQILSFIGVSISLFSLLITFATYSIFSHMRRCVSNKLIMVLCLVLFLAQLQQMLSGYGTSDETVCLALSALSHFLWISVFALTSCLAFELDRTLGSRDSFTMPTDNPTAVLSYLLFTVMTSSILVGCCLAIHFTVGEQIHFSYGNEAVCWIVDWTANLVSFGCPLALFLIVNTGLFVHTVTGIRKASKVRRSMLMENPGTEETLKDLKVYIKISTLLGFTWFFGFIAGFANISALWYVFIVLNSLQGFYIFLAFIANRRVVGMWMSLCHGNVHGLSRSRGTSSMPLSQRTASSRLTSISSLPRGDERVPNGDRKQSGDKSAGKWRYSGVSQKISEIRRTSGDRGTPGSNRGSPAEDRKNSGSPAEERRYSQGEWRNCSERKLIDRKYVTVIDQKSSAIKKDER